MEAYFVFSASSDLSPRWQKPFLWFSPKNIRHVDVFFQSGPFILRAEPRLRYCSFVTEYWTDPPLEPIPADLYARALVGQGKVVVKHKFRRNIWNITNILPTCVSLVKILTGYNSYTLTPFGLYKSLLKDGAEVITEEVM